MPASTLALLAVDLLLIAGAFLAAVAISVEGDPRPYVFDQRGWMAIAIVMAAFIGGLYFHNLYSQVYIRSRVLLLEQLCLVAGFAFILEGLISYLSTGLRLDIGAMVWGGSIATAALFGWRLFFSGYSLEVLGLDRLLLIGEGHLMSALAGYIHENPQAGFLVAGQAGEAAVATEFSTERFHQLVQESKPNRVIVGAQGGKAFAQELVELCFGGSPMEDAAACYERVCGRLSWESDPVRLIASSEFGASGNTFVYQTVFNFAVALILLVLFLPLFLIGLLAARIAVKGRLLDRRICVGLHGKRFRLWRFRRADPGSAADRIIRIGHLDAYLHLLWVLKGDLALVGPRPEPAVFVDALSQMIPYCGLRHTVRPGITGWAQIKGGELVEDAFAKLEYDLYYAKHQSLTMDVVILAQALKFVLFPQREIKPQEPRG
jgi:lipopolysaccharide/colanic/teichoic acid biosynthesis glycosyltransferase